jgi:hypothetical protein
VGTSFIGPAADLQFVRRINENFPFSEDQMELFVFSSMNLTNIWAGIGARLWAVSKRDETQVKAMVTKSRRMNVGSSGVLYCSETKSFTTPFLVYSKADATQIVANVWPEEWILPFKIHPLGTPAKQLPLSTAKERLPILRARPNDNPTHILPITPTTVFASATITSEDWEVLIQALAD